MLYRLCGVVALPLLLLYLFGRGCKDRRYWGSLWQRLGWLPQGAYLPGGIWLHAVSVGEVMAAIEFLRRLRARHPALPIWVSTGTIAGRQTAAEKLRGVADQVFYAPLDLCWIVRRVLRRLRPQLLIVMETEIWPNLYREAKRFGCGLLIANGRISDRAFPRYRHFGWFFRAVLLCPDTILSQNDAAAERYLALGAPPERVVVAGNLKYDFRAQGLQPPPVVASFLERLQPEAVWIAASTMPAAKAGDPDEDEAVIASFKQLAEGHPKLLLMLVPRHPERFEQAARKLEASGVRFVRRSQLDATTRLELPGVLLVDSMGELSSLFSLATVVFMGGTLPDRGGHNILEPAFFSRPVIIGPHMENFPDIAEEFRAAGAVLEIQDGRELAGAVRRLIQEPELRLQLGEKARRLAESRRGSVERAVATAEEIMRRQVPRNLPVLWRRVLLALPAMLWRLGVQVDRALKRRRQRRLATPVISIGGIAAGGVGKTPFTAYLAKLLRSKGVTAAILTRGFKRAQKQSLTIVAPGHRESVSRTGDEGQILLRATGVAIGIGADRFAAGARIEQQFHPSVFLLDDGFQHWKLERDLDLVLIDALDPFAGDGLLPLGRLREPLGSLKRASAFVVTRMNRPVPWMGLERELRRYNQSAPIFYSRLEPVQWVAYDRRGCFPCARFPFQEVAFFCGLGNPSAFLASLRALGISVKLGWLSRDHHRYRMAELQRFLKRVVRAGVPAIVTTEKDVVNLPDQASGLFADLPLFWLETAVVLENEDQFWSWLESRLGLPAQKAT